MLILGDPGAVSRVDKMFVVKVYCKIEMSPWALTLTESGARFSKVPVTLRARNQTFKSKYKE